MSRLFTGTVFARIECEIVLPPKIDCLRLVLQYQGNDKTWTRGNKTPKCPGKYGKALSMVNVGYILMTLASLPTIFPFVALIWLRRLVFIYFTWCWTLEGLHYDVLITWNEPICHGGTETCWMWHFSSCGNLSLVLSLSKCCCIFMWVWLVLLNKLSL